MSTAEEVAKRAAAPAPELLPGFMLLQDWLASELMQVAVGLCDDAGKPRLDVGGTVWLPCITQPTPGGCWRVEPFADEDPSAAKKAL